jgi:hypothetical protein
VTNTPGGPADKSCAGPEPEDGFPDNPDHIHWHW